jgi:hypothetical protein
MALRYIIEASGEYVVQDSGNDPMPPLPEGATEVDARPSPFHDRVGDTWVEDTERKTLALSLEVRGLRDSKLTNEVDPVVSNPLRWADLSAQEQADVSAYRLALLDVPQQQGFPHTISWPTKPSCL